MSISVLKYLGVKDALKTFYNEAWLPLYTTFTQREKMLSWFSLIALILSIFKSPKWFWLSLGLILGGKALKRHATPENWEAYVKPSAKKGVLFLLDKYL